MRRIKFFLWVQAAILVTCISANAQVLSNQYEITAFPDLNTLQAPVKPNGPEWMNNAVFYEIYPQTFYDTDGDGIGDIKGIIAKLDYVKSLGVDAIWLNPFYESPFRDAGYDVSDYYKVAPRYGTNSDAKEMFRVAKEKGLHIIIDFVPGHTSIDHPWFKASCSPTPNKYSNWYIWTNGTWFNNMDKYKENFIQGFCDRDGNFMTNFFWHQPALNYGWGQPDTLQKWQLAINNPDVVALKEEMKKVLRFWLDMGADGFRCDMAGSLVKNDPDKKICLFWQDVRKMLDKDYPNAFIVSEWSDPETAIKCGFHADFLHWFPGYDYLWANSNSFFRAEGKGDITGFLKMYNKQYEATAGKGYISLPVGNHDLARINRDGRDTKDLELIYVFQFTMPNIPFIYYGDEIGMRNISSLVSKEGSYGRSGARTPMQWSNGKNLGFSGGSKENLYLPVDSLSNAPTVASEEKDKTSLLNFVRNLVAFKKNHPALLGYASFYPVYAMPEKYPYVFIRATPDETLLIALNPSTTDQSTEISNGADLKKSLLFGTESDWKSKDGKITLNMKGKSYSIYKLVKNKK
jgi:maltose alpha-D-glucosyltransferase/alpha-amylase